jgi:hypothetical protein
LHRRFKQREFYAIEKIHSTFLWKASLHRVECRPPKTEKSEIASICPSNTYIKPHFQAKNELDSGDTVVLTSECQNALTFFGEHFGKFYGLVQ